MTDHLGFNNSPQGSSLEKILIYSSSYVSVSVSLTLLIRNLLHENISLSINKILEEYSYLFLYTTKWGDIYQYFNNGLGGNSKYDSIKNIGYYWVKIRSFIRKMAWVLDEFNLKLTGL